MERAIVDVLITISSFTLLAAGVGVLLEAWTRQQQAKLIRASNTRLLKR